MFEIPGQMFHYAMMGKSRLYGYIDVKGQLKKSPSQTDSTIHVLERHSPSGGRSQLVFSQAWSYVGSVLPKYPQ